MWQGFDYRQEGEQQAIKQYGFVAFSAGDDDSSGQSEWIRITVSGQLVRVPEFLNGAPNVTVLFSPSPGVTFFVTEVSEVGRNPRQTITVPYVPPPS